MDFIDELIEQGVFEDENSTSEFVSQVGTTEKGAVGDVCYYDVFDNRFYVASAFDQSKISTGSIVRDNRVIVIGIIINQHDEDNTVDVLMSGFLMKTPLELPIMYYHRDKQPYIRAYVYKMYQRFIKAFFKQCPGYEPLLNLDVTFPTVSDMLKIQANSAHIFDGLEEVSEDKDRFDQFVKRMFRNYIYVRHSNGRIYQMRISEEGEGNEDIRVPVATIDGDFLCVFRHVDAFDSQINNKIEPIPDDERVFFQ